MSFIRAKEIPPGSGNWYDYEVDTVHEGKRVIQKHITGISANHPEAGFHVLRALAVLHVRLTLPLR